MNEQDNKRNLMYGKIPAVAQLNKVPGFDPLQFLRPVISEETQEGLLKLDLRYQKLWFRLAHPQGRMKLTALRITDQMAIFEAKVFLDRSDTEPFSSFVASLSRQDTPNYIKAAQEDALKTALSDAGFGLQFADVSMGQDGERCGSTIPVTAAQTSESAAELPPKQEVPAPASRNAVERPRIQNGKVSAEASETLQAAPVAAVKPVSHVEAETVEQNAAESLPVSGKEEREVDLPVRAAVPTPAAEESLPVASVEQIKAEEELPASPAGEKTETVQKLPVSRTATLEQTERLPVTPAPASDNTAAGKTIPFTSLSEAAAAMAPDNAPTGNGASEPAAEEASVTVPEQREKSAERAPRYTADMSVEDIAALMTYEEAREVKVDTGICNGWTIGRVADERTPSLKFYLYGYKGNNNVLRAAAKVMMDSLTEQKAG